MNAQTKFYKFETFLANENNADVAGQIARHSLVLYRKSKKKTAPVILELGTHNGVSTTVFH